MQYFNKRHNWSSHIFRAGSRLSDLTTDFEISEPSLVEFSGYANVKHRNVAPGAVFCSSRVGYRSVPTLADLPPYPTGARSEPLWQDATRPLTWVPGAKDGKNIRDITHHYETLLLVGSWVFPPGAHRLEAWLFSGTDSPGYTTRDDLIEVNRDTNQSETETFGFFAVKVQSMVGR